MQIPTLSLLASQTKTKHTIEASLNARRDAFGQVSTAAPAWFGAMPHEVFVAGGGQHPFGGQAKPHLRHTLLMRAVVTLVGHLVEVGGHFVLLQAEGEMFEGSADLLTWLSLTLTSKIRIWHSVCWENHCSSSH